MQKKHQMSAKLPTNKINNSIDLGSKIKTIASLNLTSDSVLFIELIEKIDSKEALLAQKDLSNYLGCKVVITHGIKDIKVINKKEEDLK